MQNEEEIIQGCVHKVKACEDQLYAYFAPITFAICLRYLSNADDAKDVFQEAFVKVYLQIKSYNKQGSFDGWVKRIFVNTALDFCRKNKSFQFTTFEDKHEYDTPLEVADETVDIPKEKLLQFIRDLPDGYRIVFNLYAIEKYSHKQISEALNIEEGTSKSQLFKARKMLQREIIKFQQNINQLS